jgi:tartrate/fumarate subfamily iron-sulfur-dependent hydro-lyase alpha chain
MEIDFETLEDCAAQLYWRALRVLPPDVMELLESARDREDGDASEILDSIIENSRLASASGNQIICQDTGIPVFLVELGKGCCLTCDPSEALSSGVARATEEHSLRANCVNVLTRANTGTNSGREYPVVRVIPSAEGTARITLLAKGSGSESRSRLSMLDPVLGIEGIRRFVLETVAEGAPRSCPPVVVGVGIGGSFDSVAALAKRALARPLRQRSPDPDLAELEEELLSEINSLGIGPMGLGGRTTALWVSIESTDTHLTLNPVAVNLSCWAHRRASARLVEGGFEVEE